MIQTKLFDIYRDAKPNFGRHESFPPRHGWLKKGYDAVTKNYQIFSAEDVTVTLGVGKNQAKAIRYWCKAFKLIEEAEGEAGMVTTKFGDDLLSTKTGIDPYLEDPDTLWLLHWKLMQQPCYATSWEFVFGRYGNSSFTVAELESKIKEYCIANAWKVAQSSIRKDISCLIRMYLPSPHNPLKLDESINSPFTSLGLLQSSVREFKQKGNTFSEQDSYIFSYNKLIPGNILVYACLDYMILTQGANIKTCSLSFLLYPHGSPGQVFKVTESYLCEAIEKVAKEHKELNLAETAGIVNFSCIIPLEEMKSKLITLNWS